MAKVKKEYSLKRLKPHHHKAITLAMKGYSRSEIASELDCSYQAVVNWFRAPIFKTEMDKYFYPM